MRIRHLFTRQIPLTLVLAIGLAGAASATSLRMPSQVPAEDLVTPVHSGSYYGGYTIRRHKGHRNYGRHHRKLRGHRSYYGHGYYGGHSSHGYHGGHGYYGGHGSHGYYGRYRRDPTSIPGFNR